MKKNSNTDNLDQYILITQTKSWYNAQSFCQTEYNSSLATITTENDLHNAMRVGMDIPNDWVWIGLTDNSNYTKEGTWIWIDGTSWYANCNYMFIIHNIWHKKLHFMHN